MKFYAYMHVVALLLEHLGRICTGNLGAIAVNKSKFLLSGSAILTTSLSIAKSMGANVPPPVFPFLIFVVVVSAFRSDLNGD
jgi:hypothetical protein